MLTHPTLDTLHNLGLYGLAKGFKELANNAGAAGLEHAEWLGIILEHEVTLRRDKRFQARMRAARLRQTATIEDVDFKTHRGLDRTLLLKLATGSWIKAYQNLIITGPCGVGKSWLACALGTEPAEMIFLCSTGARRDYSPPWLWPAATGVTRNC